MIDQEKTTQPLFQNLRENVLTNSVQAQLWKNTPQLDLLKSRARKLLVPLSILFLFNIGIYSFLGRQETDSKFRGAYATEFNEFPEDDWFNIEGNWEVRDGALIQNDYIATNAAVAVSLKAEAADTSTMSADVALGELGEGGGLLFNMWSPNQIARSHRVAIVKQADLFFIEGGYFSDTLEFVQQFKMPLSDILRENNGGTIRIVTDQSAYDVFLNDFEMISDVPSVYAPGWHGFSVTGNATTIDNASIQVTPGNLYVEDTGFLSRLFSGNSEPLIPATSIAIGGESLIAPSNGQLSQTGWIPFNGSWTERNGIIIQGSTTQSDARISFDKAYDRYRLEVDLWHPNKPGGAGIIFGMPQPNELANAYLVRFSDDGAGLFIGQFNQNEVFEGLNFVPTEPLGTNIQSIDIESNGFNYQVYLNDEAVFGELPALSGRSFFGLVSNQAEVAYERIFISPLNAIPAGAIQQPSAPPVAVEAAAEAPITEETIPEQETQSAATTDDPVAAAEASTTISGSELDDITGEPFFQSTFVGTIGETNWIPFRGEWSIEEGALLQRDQNGFDFGIGFNEEYTDYVLRTRFTHIEGKGGGVLFAMDRPDSRNLSHVVRYDSDQSAILFGYFDENGQFNAQGGEAVPEPFNTQHQFDVVKYSETYDVYVDGLKVVGDVPLFNNGPFIGLTNSTSVVQFDSVEVFPLNEVVEPVEAESQSTETEGGIENTELETEDTSTDDGE